MRPSFDTNKQKTNRHVNPAQTHVHTIDTDMHAGYTFPPSCTRKGTRTGTHRSGDDMMTFCRPFPLSHTHKHTHTHTTHTHTLSLSWFGWEMKRGKCPAQSTSAAVADNCRCCRSFDSSRAFCFRTCMRQPHFSPPSFFFWCAKKQQEHALSHVHTLVSHSTPTHPPSSVPVHTQRRDGIA